MYAAVDKDMDYVAIHYDLDVVKSYVSECSNIQIIKLKRKNIPEDILADKFLTNYGSGYVPMEYHSIANDLDEDIAYDITKAIDTLSRVAFTSDNIGKKQYKHLIKSIKILMSELEEVSCDNISPDTLKELKEMSDAYRGKIDYKENQP